VDPLAHGLCPVGQRRERDLVGALAGIGRVQHRRHVARSAPIDSHARRAVAHHVQAHAPGLKLRGLGAASGTRDEDGDQGGQPGRRYLLELCAAAFLASGATSAWPLVAPAQQPAKVGRVGWIWGGPSAGNPIEAAGFRQGLKELGYIEGRDVVVDYRFGEGRIDRLTDLVGELVQLRPDVLVALGDLTARAVKSVTTTIPVVSMTGDPVGAGLVASLARPGGNITGVSMMKGLEGLAGKRVELLKDAVPAATRIALIFNPDNPTLVRSLAQADEVANRLGVVVRASPVQPGDEIEAAIAALARGSVDGVDIEPTLPFAATLERPGRFC
jgi:putative ABC transport system substrate-binding protein